MFTSADAPAPFPSQKAQRAQKRAAAKKKKAWPQWRIIYVLLEGRRMTAREISAETGISYGMVFAVLNRLRHAGCVRIAEVLPRKGKGGAPIRIYDHGREEMPSGYLRSSPRAAPAARPKTSSGSGQFAGPCYRRGWGGWGGWGVW